MSIPFSQRELIPNFEFGYSNETIEEFVFSQRMRNKTKYANEESKTRVCNTVNIFEISRIHIVHPVSC